MESAGSTSQNFKKGYEVLLQTLYEGYFKSFASPSHSPHVVTLCAHVTEGIRKFGIQ